MTQAENCLGAIVSWLRDMTPQRSGDAEDAVAELRACVGGLSGGEAQLLVPVLSRTAHLAAHAHSLWSQVAADNGGPAYKPQQ